jgi:hypothetical protein
MVPLWPCAVSTDGHAYLMRPWRAARAALIVESGTAITDFRKGRVVRVPDTVVHWVSQPASGWPS